MHKIDRQYGCVSDSGCHKIYLSQGWPKTDMVVKTKVSMGDLEPRIYYVTSDQKTIKN
jgi:hypothetical protein